MHTITEVAESVVGLSANLSNPEKRNRYIELIAPGESAHMVASMVTMSGCGLVVAGIWRRAGLTHHLLDSPYKIGHAIIRLVQIAKENAAWITAKSGEFPLPGNMVMVGDDTPSGGVTHVYTVITVDPTTKVLTSVDGGQKESGFQCVTKKTRSWASGRDVVFTGSDPGSRTIGGRKIVGWVNTDKLPFSTDEDIYGP